MSEADNIFDQAHHLLGRFDFAAQLSAREAEHKEELRALLVSFLEVMDSFDRLFAGSPGAEEMSMPVSLSTIRLIALQLENALRAAGVTPIACLGEQALPGRHQVIGTKEVRVEDNTIVEELQRGYEWHGEILRKPCVLVAQRANEVTDENKPL